MTTKQIDYCIGLAHTLNFSRAADNMFVSQPTFSYQIRLLQKTEGRSFCICPLVYTDINKGTDTKGPSPRTTHGLSSAYQRNAPLQTWITWPFTCFPMSEARNRHAFA